VQENNNSTDLTILPTGKCFDDVFAFVEMRLAENPELLDRLTIVHGVCLFPDDQEEAGKPFAHAWVIERDSVVWQGGLLRGERVWYSMPFGEFTLQLRVQRATPYSLRTAAAENKRTGHLGPWLEEYRALCNDTKAAVEVQP